MNLVYTPRSHTRLRMHHLAVLAAALVFGLSAQAQPPSTTTSPVPLSSEAYAKAKDRIDNDYNAAKDACDRLSGNAEDICTEQAKGQKKVAEAELAYQRSGERGDAIKIKQAQAEATYEVAKQRCDDLNGNQKDVCMKEAQAAETRAKADAKLADRGADARREAAEDKRDASYEVAQERCENLGGNAKDNCESAAKARYDKR